MGILEVELYLSTRVSDFTPPCSLVCPLYITCSVWRG